MGRYLLFVVAVIAITTLPVGNAVWAADEHGHSHGAPGQSAGAALPRFAAVSEAFELVGVVNGKTVTFYLDRAPDNSPVTGAQLQVELGGTRLDVKPHGEGEFEAVLAQELKPGIIPVTATIVVGNESDLLAGDLEVHAAAVEAGHTHGWGEYKTSIAVAVASLVVLALLIYLAMRARRSRTRVAI